MRESPADGGPPRAGEALLQTFPGARPSDVTVRELPGRPARTVPASDVLRPALADRLDADLYAHQAAALTRLDVGENVCVSTSTASGKTWVYALQAARNYLDARRRADERGGDDDATAYLVYPTRALSRDQERELDDLYDRLGLDLTVRVYDGDTDRGETRRRIRAEADVVVTNFAGVNAYLHTHDRWARFFRACELVVVDESHAYTGVHGMHVAWIIRRLRRVLEYYGADPQYVLTSATVGNPAEHAAALVGDEVAVVDDDGSPRGPRDLVLWNPPPKTDTDDGGRRDARAGSEGPSRVERLPASVEAPRVFSHLTYRGLQTLLFTPSRKLAELSVRRAERHRDDRRRHYPNRDRGRALEPYHAGHSRDTRHATEYQLKTGVLDGVSSTNALELGIDVGGMDATVQLGYPGQRQSFWQQIGRAGRGERRALSVLVADYRTLDQYVVDNPDYLLETDVEDAVVDTGNDAVFARHLLCAADEVALTEADVDAFAAEDRLRDAVQMWRRAGRLTGYLAAGVSYVGPPRPQADVSLYAASDDQYEVRLADGVSADADPEMEPLSKERVFRDFHEGAVRLHEGVQYEVTAVVHDSPNPHVTVRPTDVAYYTQTRSDVTVLDATSQESREVNGFRLHFGEGTVMVSHAAYDKLPIDGGDPIEESLATNLPPLTMETDLCWVEVPTDVERALVETYRDYAVPELPGEANDAVHLGYVGGLHAAEHAMIGVAPLELMLEKRDLGGLSTLTIDAHLRRDDPAGGADVPPSIEGARAAMRRTSEALDRTPSSGWFVYDGVEGGLGFARSIYEDFEALARRTREMIAACDCGRVEGCPACVMDENCGNDNAPLHRGAAVDVLDHLLDDVGAVDVDEDRPDGERGAERRPPLSYS